ncbi:uncharacterized protein VTP21DRAFT_22 [Calcarisporiella thermophila]|uniref:uncharacterized protein n=1 Tax=Calcarisporiella thermophila TaxID=911321 RepID=UPI00374421EA
MGNWVKAGIVSAAIIGLGYGLYKTTVPNDREIFERLPPHVQEQLNKEASERKKQKEALMANMRQAAQPEQTPIWHTNSK